MKKNNKKLIKNSLLGLSVIGTAIVANVIQADALNLGDFGETKVIPTEIGQNNTVLKYKFNSAYNSEQSVYYNSRGMEMYLEEYWPEDSNLPGGFVWYSIVPNEITSLSQTDMSRMLENRQTVTGHGGDHLVSGAGLNLKYGAGDPWTGDYQGNNKGTKTIQYGTYKGKRYEWRFIGYNGLGGLVGNPYFPADDQSGALESVSTKAQSGVYWSNRNWIHQGWTLPKSINTFGPPDDYNKYSQKVQWIKDYFFIDYPAFKNKGSAEYWANIFRPLTDPSKETGVWLGWHRAGGVNWYVTLITTPPKQNNLRLVRYEIRDSKGTLVAEQTRNSANYNAVHANDPILHEPWIHKGEKYTIKTWVKNMPDKVQNVQAPMKLENKGLFDANIGSDNYAYTYTDTADAPYGNGLPSGQTAVFTSTYTVPESGRPQENIEFKAKIPGSFFDLGYNTNKEDDDASIIMEIAPENLAVEFDGYYDEAQNPVDYVTPNQQMWVKYHVEKTDGTKPVNGADLKIRVTDKLTVDRTNTFALEGAYTKNGTPIANKVLKNEGDYAVFSASVTPRQPKLCTEASIPGKWATQGVNNWSEDDVAKPPCLVNPDNIVVSDVDAKPDTVFLAESQGSKSIQYTVEYKLTNYNYDKKDKTIPVVYSIDGKIVATEEIPVDSLKTMKISKVLPPVQVGEGQHRIQVEANPVPRKYVEIKTNYLGEEINPYTDNIGWDDVNVEKNKEAFHCAIRNTSNYWNTTFTETYSYGWSWTHCTEDECHTHYETDYYYRYPTISFYETQEIKNIYFKSKFTEDNYGGWVDLLNTKGIIKAGYGFELKVVTQYKTNTYNDTPKPWNDGWHYGTYAMSVSPRETWVDSSARLKITMPFTDDYGKPIAVVLNGNQSGNWYSTTTTYELEPRKVINKTERKIYINENTKDGNYNIRIETEPFYGSYDKPYTSEVLCDIKNITVEVRGSYLDDVKTHIIQ